MLGGPFKFKKSRRDRGKSSVMRDSQEKTAWLPAPFVLELWTECEHFLRIQRGTAEIYHKRGENYLRI